MKPRVGRARFAVWALRAAMVLASAPSYAAPAKKPVAGKGASIVDPHRTAVAARLRGYGPAWNLDEIETRFTLSIEDTPDRYKLTFTARGASGLVSRHELEKKPGGLFSGGPVQVPAGASLTAAQLATVEQVLKATGQLWMRMPSNLVQPLDLAKGVTALAAGRTLETRARAGRAVLYIHDASDARDLFVLEIDLAKKQIVGASWQGVLPNQTLYLPPSLVAFFDKAFRTHGDHGQHGSVAKGFAEAAKGGMSIEVTPRGWGFMIGFVDAPTYEVNFAVLKDGTIDGWALAWQ